MPFRQARFKIETSDGRNCTLLEDVSYFSFAGEEIVIPAGTTTDGFSTPKALWPSIPPFGIGWRAAVLHDYLYRFTDRSKHECDDLLLEALLGMGVEDSLARIIYDGVRQCGGIAFRADRIT